MPLSDFERAPGKKIERIFFEDQYEGWKRSLAGVDPLALSAIFAHIDGRFSEQAASRKPLITMGWEPGSVWAGTVFDPIWHACNGSEAQSAQFLGLIFMDVAMRRPENWGFGHYDLPRPDGTLAPIKSRTYFLLDSQIPQ